METGVGIGEKVKKLTINEMKIGDSASTTKTISECDVYMFAGITGDFNPAHTDEITASKTIVQRQDRPWNAQRGTDFRGDRDEAPRPRHHLYGAVSALFETGPYRRYHHHPCTVSKIIRRKTRVELETVCRNQKNDVVTTGTATVLAPN
jgi:3-hydroxybutyryl-CoA dehydratase